MNLAGARSLHTVILACRPEGHKYDGTGWFDIWYRGMEACLHALATGAPAVAKLQLVLPANEHCRWGMRELWGLLERWGRLASLTLSLVVDYDAEEEGAGEGVVALLDGMETRLPGVTDLCLHTVNITLDWTGRGSTRWTQMCRHAA